VTLLSIFDVTEAAPRAGSRLGQGSELRLGVDYALDAAEQIEGAAGEAVDSRHRHSVARTSLPSIRFSSRRSARAAETFSRQMLLLPHPAFSTVFLISCTVESRHSPTPAP